MVKTLEDLQPHTPLILPIVIYQQRLSKNEFHFQYLVGLSCFTIGLYLCYVIGSLAFKINHDLITTALRILFNPFTWVVFWLGYLALTGAKKSLKRFDQLPQQFVFANISQNTIEIYSHLNELCFDSTFDNLEYCKSHVFKGTHIFEIKAKNSKKVGFGVSSELTSTIDNQDYRLKGYDVAYIINLAKNRTDKCVMLFKKGLYINGY